MRMHRRFGPRFVHPLLSMRSKILRRGDRGDRPDLGYLVATERRSAFRAQCEEPNLTCHFGGKPGRACCRLRLSERGKLSIRQNKGPGGNCWTFFSATGLISNFCAESR